MSFVVYRLPHEHRGPFFQSSKHSLTAMRDFGERSAYPHPEEFEVMRPEYTELEDGYIQASITVMTFRVTGKSTTRPGARRAALYEGQKTYRSYHPSYRIKNPFPDAFVDQEGIQWKRIPAMRRHTTGDYLFISEDDDEDYTDFEQMLMWDVRPVKLITDEG